jgi:hypothetical protein
MNTSGTITFGTTAITFTVIAETAVYSAGDSLTLTGTTFDTVQDIRTTASPTFAGVTAPLTGNVTGNVTGDITGNVTGNLTGNVTGNADTATALATARTIQLSGDVTGSVSFDGTGDVNITATVGDDTHAHIIDNVDGLQAALDAKADDSTTFTAGNYLTGGGTLGANRTFDVDATSANTASKVVARDASGNFSAGTITATLSGNASTATSAAALTTARTISLTGDVSGSTSFDGSGNVSITATVADDSHNHITSNIDGLAEYIADTVGAMVSTNTESGITVTYDDTDNTLDFDVNDPTITLTGDVTGSATMTNLGNVSITTTVADDSHNHVISNVDGLQTALDGKSSTSHNHTLDSLSNTTITSNTSGEILKWNGSAWVNNTLAEAGIQPSGSYLTGNQTITLTGDVSGSGTTSISVTVADDSHNHVISNVDGLQTALDGKASTSHTHGKLESSYAGTYASADSAMPSTIRSFSHDLGNGPNDGHLLSMTWGSTTTYGAQIWIDTDPTGDMAVRQRNNVGTWTGWYDIWTSGNDGSGSGLDADLLDGYHLSTTRDAANTVPVRDGNGYLNLGWINTTSGATTGTINKIYASYDDYLRYITPATFRSQVTDGYYLGASSKAADSNLLDGIDSGSFARVDATSNFVSSYNTGYGAQAGTLTAYGATGATMSFHRPGYYAINMGLDSDNVFRIGGWSAASNRLQMDMSGNLTMAGNVTAYSDERLKSNIKTIEGAVDTVKALRGVTFEKDGKDGLGVIAQEVQKVLPELVHESGEYLSVAYGNMVGLLIEAIKEQQKQIDELKAKLGDK